MKNKGKQTNSAPPVPGSVDYQKEYEELLGFIEKNLNYKVGQQQTNRIQKFSLYKRNYPSPILTNNTSPIC